MMPATSSDRQLALTLYRLVHGCSFLVIRSLFGVHEDQASFIFYNICCILVTDLYADNARIPTKSDEWESQLHGYLRHHGFPCVGVWTGTNISFTNNKSEGLGIVKIPCVGLVGLKLPFLASFKLFMNIFDFFLTSQDPQTQKMCPFFFS